MAMKLDEFLSQTIIQIIDGLIVAQEYARHKSDAKSLIIYVNPKISYSSIDKTRAKTVTEDNVLHPERIDFDIAVTVSEGDKKTAGAGVFVSVLAVGAKGEIDARYSEVSRIKFSVPVVWPIQE